MAMAGIGEENNDSKASNKAYQENGMRQQRRVSVTTIIAMKISIGGTWRGISISGEKQQHHQREGSESGEKAAWRSVSKQQTKAISKQHRNKRSISAA